MRPLPWGQNFFIFMQFSTKIDQNNRLPLLGLAHFWEILDPPLPQVTWKWNELSEKLDWNGFMNITVHKVDCCERFVRVVYDNMCLDFVLTGKFWQTSLKAYSRISKIILQLLQEFALHNLSKKTNIFFDFCRFCFHFHLVWVDR